MFDNLKKKFNDNNDKIVNEDNNVNENENVNEKEQNYQIEKINNNFKKIDETKSFKDQIDILKEIPDLNDYWYIEYYEDNKDINLRLFKLKFAHIFNDVDDNLFKEIFGLISVKLADKLINTTSKEENQMLINNIKKNEDKIFEQNEFNKFVIQSATKRGDLVNAAEVILEFNETIQSDLT